MLIRPEAVEVVADTDGSYLISWTAPTPAAGFRVSVLGSELSEPAEASPHRWTTELPEGTAACFTVSAVGEGSISFPSETGCA